MIESARISVLNDRPTRPGRYVLYWMQASQRTRFSHALEYAIERANQLACPVVVGFGLMDGYPEANQRHYHFMLQGLADVARDLHARGIAMVVRHGQPPDVAQTLARDAAEVVCDRGYLRHQRRWRDQLADHCPCRLTQVESDVVVPVEVASDKAEYGARTIRPRIMRQLDQYLRPLMPRPVLKRADSLRWSGAIDVSDIGGTLAQLKLDRSVPIAHRLTGGQEAAGRQLTAFLAHCLTGYDQARNEPAADATTLLSACLHFGQISPIEIALAAIASAAPEADRDALIEQLIVRRELAINYVYYTPHYDSFDALPTWARRTLTGSAGDPRPATYTRQQLESAQTHDAYWNAAMREMLTTGYMHNYMRMYWGKKVLEWKADPREAFDDLLYLNNRYFLDGRDPNSYTGVAWCFGLHDRPWTRRPIFGQVRYMNSAGLDRKFDMPAYVKKVHGYRW